MTIAAYQVSASSSSPNLPLPGLPPAPGSVTLCCPPWPQTLYESSIAFGMRKALQTEQGKSDMEARIQGLEADCKDYERQVTLAKHKPPLPELCLPSTDPPHPAVSQSDGDRQNEDTVLNVQDSIS